MQQQRAVGMLLVLLGGVGTVGAKLWFEQLFGFKEGLAADYFKTQANFTLLDTTLKSLHSNETFEAGNFSRPTLGELEDQGLRLLSDGVRGETTFESYVLSDVMEEHLKHPGAMFQAASQFNCLEFPTPHTVPEDGVTNYIYDHTQGPACALAAAPGVVLRNYLVKVEGKLGQTTSRQYDNLDSFAEAFPVHHLWTIKNGYSFSNDENLTKISTILRGLSHNQTRFLLRQIRIGVHTRTQVTFSSTDSSGNPVRYKGPKVLVNQAYCSALSCSYSPGELANWEAFARVVLAAMYEGTLWSASNAYQTKQGSTSVFLTLLGGGVFGNDKEWIAEGMAKAIAKFMVLKAGLRIKVCYFRKVDVRFEELLATKVQQELHLLSEAPTPSPSTPSSSPSMGPSATPCLPASRNFIKSG